MSLQASSYGEEDVDPEGGDALMSDKVTYTFDELVNQVQVPVFCSAVLNKCLAKQHVASPLHFQQRPGSSRLRLLTALQARDSLHPPRPV